MHYIVGLGNPGKEYEGTRHNIGFAVLDSFASTNSFSSWHKSGTYHGELSKGSVGGTLVELLKPTTFMNESGVAVRSFVKKGSEQSLIVVYDDIDLALGEIKISFDRGAGGHNGMKSIIERLGTQEFVRLRIGVAQKSLFTGSLKRPKGEALPKFVLTPFGKREQKALGSGVDKASEALLSILTDGREKAANKYN